MLSIDVEPQLQRACQRQAHAASSMTSRGSAVFATEARQTTGAASFLLLSRPVSALLRDTCHGTLSQGAGRAAGTILAAPTEICRSWSALGVSSNSARTREARAVHECALRPIHLLTNSEVPMNNAHVLRKALASRLFTLIVASLPAGAAAGCNSAYTSCPDNAAEPAPTVACFAWPSEEGLDGGGGSGGAGGMAGSGEGEGVACPSRPQAEERLNRNFIAVYRVKGDGTRKDGQCCYDADATSICEGRPYLIDEVARTAPFVRTGGHGGWGAAEVKAPRVNGLDPELRVMLAAEWTRDALFEHASVASFGRFALELLAAGAPADLVAGAHEAALDEVRHARLCFALASAYAGEPITPGIFPFEGQVEVVADLASIAARAAKEGCIGETIAASIAAEQLASAEDPAVRSVLAVIAEDEARHAELAWRTVVWAVRVGGAPVREAVEEVFAGLGRGDSQATTSDEGARLSAHGRLSGKALREAAARAIDDVVRPAARLLLSSSGDGAARIALVA